MAALGAFIFGGPAACGALASGYPDFQEWSQAKFVEALEMINAPVFLTSFCAFVIIYILAVIYCFTGENEGPSEKAMEALELRRLRAYGRAQKRYDKETLKAPEENTLEMRMGDRYENRGTVNGNMGPTTNIYGKPQFEMSESVMREVAGQLGEPRNVAMSFVGSTKSFVDGNRLADFLRSKGFTITSINRIGVLAPPLSNPIELRGNELFVDSDK